MAKRERRDSALGAALLAAGFVLTAVEDVKPATIAATIVVGAIAYTGAFRRTHAESFKRRWAMAVVVGVAAGTAVIVVVDAVFVARW
jgi:hypothetical protein